MEHYDGRYARNVGIPSILSSFVVLSVVMMMMLVVGNVLQVAVWALLFLVLEEFSTFQEAVYHSMVNFSTLGYGDIVMSTKHRLLGPLEAINGVIMIGLSTAMLLAAVHDMMKKAMRAGHG